MIQKHRFVKKERNHSYRDHYLNNNLVHLLVVVVYNQYLLENQKETRVVTEVNNGYQSEMKQKVYSVTKSYRKNHFFGRRRY